MWEEVYQYYRDKGGYVDNPNAFKSMFQIWLEIIGQDFSKVVDFVRKENSKKT